MSNFREFIYNSQLEYEYRVKMTANPVEHLMDKMETHLVKYDVKKVASPVKLMLQSQNADFPNNRGVEIWHVDIVLGLPVSPRILAVELGQVLGTVDGQIVVRAPNEPGGQPPASDKETDNIPLFGDEYNSMFMKELAKAQKDRIFKYEFAAKVPEAEKVLPDSPSSPSPISGNEQEKYK